MGADFHIGLAPSEFHRVANAVPPPVLPIPDLTQLDPNSVVYKTYTGPAVQTGMKWSRTERLADIGAANGHGNARAVAHPVGGGLRRRSRWRPAALTEDDQPDLRSAKPHGRPRAGHTAQVGVGYGLPWPEVLPFVPEGRLCFGTGAGGSLVIADADRRLTVAYVMNKMVPMPAVGPIAAALVERVYDIVNR